MINWQNKDKFALCNKLDVLQDKLILKDYFLKHMEGACCIVREKGFDQEKIFCYETQLEVEGGTEDGSVINESPMKQIGDGKGFEFGVEGVEGGDQSVRFGFQVEEDGGKGDQALPGGGPSPEKIEQPPKPQSSKKIILTRGGSNQPF